MIRILVIGAGFMGRTHIEAYAKISNVKVVGVIEIDPHKVSQIEKLGLLVYKDLESAMKDLTVDVIDICLPSHLHHSVAIQAMDYGKHIICEKPIALTVEDANEMIEGAKRNGVRLFVGHVARFMPENRYLRNVTSQGLYGRPLLLSASRLSSMPEWSWNDWLKNRNQSGGTIVDLQIHDIDLANWLFGRPYQFYCEYQATKGLGHALSIITYGDGKAFLESSHIMPQGYPLSSGFRLLMERAVIELPPVGNFVTGQKTVYIFEPAKGIVSQKLFPATDPYLDQLKHFIECIRHDAQCLVSAEEAMLALDSALRLRCSAEQKLALVDKQEWVPRK